jgi:hypothetical protein
MNGHIYYPYLRIYKDYEVMKDEIRYKDNLEYVGLVTYYDSNDKTKCLYVVSGDVFSSLKKGVIGCGNINGGSKIYLALLGCATKEIATHFGKYFAKEIFDLCYKGLFNYGYVKINGTRNT